MPVKKVKLTPTPLTDEEAQMYTEGVIKGWPAAFATVAVVNLRHPDGKNTGAEGAFKCPVCMGGAIRYSMARGNGHVWARCTTTGCISFIQ